MMERLLGIKQYDPFTLGNYAQEKEHHYLLDENGQKG